ncbi:MAG TPA: tetratricopeptide repeat protein [Kofleriaceae bacterium]|jgi:tetratricopeptide (TPR) repeat protein|nr:tetratricopeptide repeat protein [Kofleriaceae bacterium]
MRASAQPASAPTVDKKQAAKKYTEAGLTAAKLGDYDTAIEFYQKAYSLVPHPTLTFDMAEAHLLAGRIDQALILYKRYLSDVPSGPLAQDARDRIAEIDASKAEEARKAEDERKAAERKAEDERKAEEARKAEESRRTDRPMPPVSAAREADSPPRERIANRRWAAWKPWMVVGGGVGIAAVGGVLDVIAAHNFDAYDSEFVKLSCSLQGCTLQEVDQDDPHLRSRLSRAKLEQQIAVAGFIAGGAAIAAGVTLLYLNQPQRSERDNPNQNALGATVVPVVSRDLVGVAVTISR